MSAKMEGARGGKEEAKEGGGAKERGEVVLEEGGGREEGGGQEEGGDKGRVTWEGVRGVGEK